MSGGENLDSEGLAADLVHELASRNLTVATAESLTGGALAAALVDVPGVSVVYLGSVVAYQSELKTSLLGVPAELLESRGSVDPQVAVSMAEGALRCSGARLAIATTGAAGPQAHDGQVPGTVYLAAVLEHRVSVSGYRFPGTRNDVRKAAVSAALALALEMLRTE